MSATIREIGLRRIAKYLETEGAHPSKTPVLALGVEHILNELGVRLPNRPPLEDPNAAPLAPAGPPGDASAGAAAARAARLPYGGVDRRAEAEPLEQLPDLPEKD